jgi:hypothetical protein
MALDGMLAVGAGRRIDAQPSAVPLLLWWVALPKGVVVAVVLSECAWIAGKRLNCTAHDAEQAQRTPTPHSCDGQ